ncbi:MAG: dienelactone hydrolase family protein [Candidatus Melainabacteria bacterium]|nr:dienelactone hydrolase family protein [Candidatus Melainabacteria bacterium]
MSRGKPIRVEWFRPSHDSGKPVVLILYGASGGEDSEYFRGCAQQFADAGFVAGVVHYFDSVDIKWANSAQMSKYFQSWLGTVDDAVTCSQKQFGAKRKVDLFGYSLGAQLALSCAARDARIGAVSSMSGCFVCPPAKASRMPPVLILHGARDSTVSLQREKRTEMQLKQLGTPYEVHIYAKQGHCFDSELAQDAILRSIAFFKKQAIVAQGLH